MILKTYKIYFIKKFTSTLINILLVFFVIVLIVSLFEEMSFFSNTNVSIVTPLTLSFLNAPSVIYEMLPFIFLISTQFFFMHLQKNEELTTFKYFTLTNIQLIKNLSIISFVLGLIMVTFFYNFSSVLKHNYLQIKNQYSNDNKYLAVVTENGIWIKDEIEEITSIINADKIIERQLINVTISQFDKDFNLLRNISSENIDITNKNWVLSNSIIIKENQNSQFNENMTLVSNFDINKINSMFSNLSSLTIFELFKLKNDYKKIGYSTNDIEIQIQKIYSFAFYLMIMTVLSAILMINIKNQKNVFVNVILGISFSVIIYYINYFINLMGTNNTLPIMISIWLPMFVLTLLISIGLVGLNEK